MSGLDRNTRSRCIGLYRSGNGFHAIEDQINSIEKTIGVNDFELVAIKDLSIGENDSVDILTRELLQKKIDCLTVWRLDCLAPLLPNFESVVAFIVHLSSFNITFISIEDKLDSDDNASHFLTNLQAAWTELKRNRKIENARNSSLKSKATGRKPGPTKKRDDEKIIQLRQKGLSIREIAKKTNLSSALVHRVLKKISQETIRNERELPTLG